MKATQKRLDNLEADQSPKEAVLTMVARIQEFETLDDYIRWSFTDKALAEMLKSRDKRYQAILKKTSGEETNRALKKLSGEFEYLYHLAMAPCARVDSNHYRYLCLIMTAVHLMTSLWHDMQMVQDERQTQEILGNICQALETVYVDLRSEKKAADALSRQYFDGRPLLLPSQETFLSGCAEWVSQLIETFNRDAALFREVNDDSGEWDVLPIEVESLEHRAETKSAAKVCQMTSEARADLYDKVGRHRDALKAFQEMIHPKGSQ